MRLFSRNSNLRGRDRSRTSAAFTLPELLIAMTIFVMLIGGIISAHLYGLSMYHITQTKLNATDHLRGTIERLANEVRTCRVVAVGNITTNGSFAGTLDGEMQQGNCLYIQPTDDTNRYIVYFVNPLDMTLRRATNAPGNTVILSYSISNSLPFCVQDYHGTVLTNNQNSRVIHAEFEFYQPKRFRQVGEYYKLETAVTRRALE